MDLGTPVRSLSIGGVECRGFTSDSEGKTSSSDWRIEGRRLNGVEDSVRFGCGEVRGREWERRSDGTRTGYGDSWSKTMELIEPSRASNRAGGGLDDRGVSREGILGGYRSAGEIRLATDSRDEPSAVGGAECAIDGAGRLGIGDDVRGDVRSDTVREGGALAGPAETESFLFFLQSDLMLLTGLSEALARLFLPSSESIEKRLDGIVDVASV